MGRRLHLCVLTGVKALHGGSGAGQPQVLPKTAVGGKVIYNKKDTFGLLHRSWHRATETLIFPK